MINANELNIVKKQYQDAIVDYINIRHQFGFLLGKDKRNLAVCFLKKGQVNEAKMFLNELVQMGVSAEWLLRNKEIAKSFSPSDFQSNTKANVNSLLNDSLKSIYDRDQKVRRMPNAYNNYSKQITESDSINAAELHIISDTYHGLPGESIIGYNDPSIVFQPYYIHILHQTKARRVVDYSQSILEEIKKGRVDPYVGAFLFEKTSGDLSFFGPLSILKILYPTDSVPEEKFHNPDFVEEYSKLYPSYILDSKEADGFKQDSIRVSFGLDSIKNFSLKSVFQLNNPEFLFFNPAFLSSNYICASKKDADLISQWYKQIIVD